MAERLDGGDATTARARTRLRERKDEREGHRRILTSTRSSGRGVFVVWEAAADEIDGGSSKLDDGGYVARVRGGSGASLGF